MQICTFWKLTLGHDQVSHAATVEVAHEALIRSWPTLRSWVLDARADLLLHIQLAEAAKVGPTTARTKNLCGRGGG